MVAPRHLLPLLQYCTYTDWYGYGQALVKQLKFICVIFKALNLKQDSYIHF
jgi:hypothetical protein